MLSNLVCLELACSLPRGPGGHPAKTLRTLANKAKDLENTIQETEFATQAENRQMLRHFRALSRALRRYISFVANRTPGQDRAREKKLTANLWEGFNRLRLQELNWCLARYAALPIDRAGKARDPDEERLSYATVRFT